MKTIRLGHIAATLSLSLILALRVVAGTGPSPQTPCGPPLTAAAAEVTTGPAVGERIPPFSARDQRGDIRDFESISGPKGAVILFFRSADW